MNMCIHWERLGSRFRTHNTFTVHTMYAYMYTLCTYMIHKQMIV